MLRLKPGPGFPKNFNFVLKFSLVLIALLLVHLDPVFSQNEESETTTVTEEVIESTTITNTIAENADSFVKKLDSFLDSDYKPQTLRKCSKNVKEQFLNVPIALQAHSVQFQSFRVPHFQKKYGPFIYNFTLVDLDLDLDPEIELQGRGQRFNKKSPCNNIVMDDEEMFNGTTNGEPSDLYHQLSLEGGVNAKGNRFFFNPDGFLIRFRGTSDIAYNPINFCVARIEPQNIWIRLCTETCSFDKGWNANAGKGGGICVPKCCRFGFVQRTTESGKYSCSSVYDNDWAPIPPKFSQGQGQSPGQETFFEFQLNNPIDHKWKCSLSKYLMLKDGLWVLPTGEIYRRNSTICRNWELFDLTWVTPDKWKEPEGASSKMCMDGIWNSNLNSSSGTSVDHYDPNDPRANHLLWFCEHEPEFPIPQFYPTVQFFVYLIASLIHVVTLGVFVSLWSQQNVHGYTTMAFCLGQFFLELIHFLVRVVVVFHNDDYHQLGTCRLIQLCIALGALEQFCFIMCFAWTTVLCFDIFSKIRSMRAGSKKKGWSRFGLYSIFGCGVPLIWTTVALVIDGNTEQMDNIIRPDFSYNCFMDKAMPVYVYITLPISLLALTNLVLTFFTVKFVWESKKNMKSMKDSASSKDDNNMKLIVKLCVMMGVFLLFHVMYSIRNPVVGISSYLVFLEFYWILQAGATFWIFVWNERTLKQLTSTYPILSKLFRSNQDITTTSLTATTTTTLSSTAT